MERAAILDVVYAVILDAMRYSRELPFEPSPEDARLFTLRVQAVLEEARP